jgi:hypothetical protein
MPSGGTSSKKKHKGGKDDGKYSRGGFHRPPFMSYDPSLEAQRRATQRGLGDLRKDTKRGIHRARKDFRLQRKDTLVSKRRGLQDFATQLERGLQNLRFERQDINLKAARGMEDFGLRLQNLTRSYATLGQNQTQAANASGVYDAGTAAASAARRASNFRVEKQPIKIGEQRLQEDQITSLKRLGIEDEASARDPRGEDRQHRHLAAGDFRCTAASPRRVHEIREA